jgi:hypothetical protein
MKLNRTIIPNDSHLHDWMDRWSNTEIFDSWKILTGLSVIGVILRRNVCYDFGQAGKLWPNTSVLLVGPSGSGKDTIINPSCVTIENVGGLSVVGRTLEAVKEALAQMGDPAVGYINASELADFLGCKDYQAGMVQALTDILSNKEKVDVSLKSDLLKGISRNIRNPTVTMFAGSTAEWLQGMLPPGSLDGGFIPRFVVAAEWSKADEGIAPVAHPGQYENPAHRSLIETGAQRYEDFLIEVAQRTSKGRDDPPRRMTETRGMDNAWGWYENWYANRYSKFSPLLQAYASRSGGLMQRLGLLMAISREHYTTIQEEDYFFADTIIQHAAERLEQAVIPQAREVKVAWEVLRLLPLRYPEIIRTLAGKHGQVWVKRAIGYLAETEQIQQTKEGSFVRSSNSSIE